MLGSFAVVQTFHERLISCLCIHTNRFQFSITFSVLQAPLNTSKHCQYGLSARAGLSLLAFGLRHNTTITKSFLQHGLTLLGAAENCLLDASFRNKAVNERGESLPKPVYTACASMHTNVKTTYSGVDCTKTVSWICPME